MKPYLNNQDKKGEWLVTEIGYFDCSLCGQSYYNGAASKEESEHIFILGETYNYCPYCGAKMY